MLLRLAYLTAANALALRHQLLVLQCQAAGEEMRNLA